MKDGFSITNGFGLHNLLTAHVLCNTSKLNDTQILLTLYHTLLRMVSKVNVVNLLEDCT